MQEGPPLGSKFSVTDVVVWLTTKNFGAYAPNFKKKKIDGVKLLQLNEDDLRSLGVGVRLGVGCLGWTGCGDRQ